MKFRVALVVVLAAVGVVGVHCGGETQPPLTPSSDPAVPASADADAAAPQAPPGELPKK